MSSLIILMTIRKYNAVVIFDSQGEMRPLVNMK